VRNVVGVAIKAKPVGWLFFLTDGRSIGYPVGERRGKKILSYVQIALVSTTMSSLMSRDMMFSRE
jgi:hypothetical protein